MGGTAPPLAAYLGWGKEGMPRVGGGSYLIKDFKRSPAAASMSSYSAMPGLPPGHLSRHLLL